jgi:polysaccharide biosynthesis PFTS motif protein
MRIPLISDFVERRAQRRLRSAMRGYRSLRTSNQLDRIARVKDALKHLRLDHSVDHASERFFGAAPSQNEISVRQYLLVRLAGLDLGEALVRSLAKPEAEVVKALPPEWRRILVEHGFKVAPFRSKVIWQAFVAAHFFFGASLLAKRLLASAKQIIRPVNQKHARFVYFDALTPNALPHKAVDGKSHDVMSWYRQRIGETKKFDAFCHGLKSIPPTMLGDTEVFPMGGPIPPLDRLDSLVKFFAWGAAAVIEAFVGSVRGQWVHAIMLNESVKAAQARFQQPERLAREYLFHNSGCVYRPLWTYEAEQHGCKVVLYFYSANCEPFKRPDGYPKVNNDYYEVMSWPHYMVWDAYQTEFIRRSVGEDAGVEVVGPIWFSASAENLPPLPLVTIAVFDVQPVRASLYQRLGIDFDYYTPANTTSFLTDCHAASKACGATMALKRKRNIGTLAHPMYEYFVARLSKECGFTAINSDVSASRLIEKCIAVVSMPFTSTALLGRALGKPSAYYDPHGMIQRDDRAAHGIEILLGPKELQAWLANVTISYGLGDGGGKN